MAIKVYYQRLENMGDLLNEYIIPFVTGQEVIHCLKKDSFDVMGIGSSVHDIFRISGGGIRRRVKEIRKSIVCLGATKPCAVWGMGFGVDLSNRKLTLLRKNASFIAVRGQLSKQIIEASIKKEIDPVLGDGGILSSDIMRMDTQKKYKVGFIPHFMEQDLCKEKQIWQHYDNGSSDSVVIDLRQDPLKVLEEIASCETVISSSLHGCICADSFHVPNMHIRLSDIPGTGFKFNDYYSSYGLYIPPLLVNTVTDLPSACDIVNNYQLSYEDIERKKIEMRCCLQKYVRDNPIA